MCLKYVHFFGKYISVMAILIGDSLSCSGPNQLHLEYIEEAAHDTSSALAIFAHRGVRKQSVKDVECRISDAMVEWADRNNYVCETEYLCSICGWRRDCNETGVTSDQ